MRPGFYRCRILYENDTRIAVFWRLSVNIHRAVGDASSEGAAAHIHPWWQYLKWIFLGNAVKDGPMHWTCRFSEVGILTQIFLIQLPVAAVCFALKKRTSPSIRNGYLYICAYTAVLFALYSAIPYKTPWCSLQMLTGLVVALSLGYALIADILTKAYPNARNVKLAAALIPLSLSAPTSSDIFCSLSCNKIKK